MPRILFVPRWKNQVELCSLLNAELASIGPSDCAMICLDHFIGTELYSRMSEIGIPVYRLENKSGFRLTDPKGGFFRRNYRSIRFQRHAKSVIEDFLEQHPFDCLVMVDDRETSRFFMDKGKSQGAKTVLLTEGSTGHYRPSFPRRVHSFVANYFYFLFTGTRMTPMFFSECDVMAVGGEAEKKAMESVHPNRRVVVTGQPRFDRLTPFIGKRKVEKTKRKMVLYATQPLYQDGYASQDVAREVNKALLATMAGLTMYDFIVKLHPRDDRGFFEELMRAAPSANIEITREENLPELISRASALLMFSSTTGLEALILDCPLIIAQLIRTPFFIPYTEYGAAVPLNRADELQIAIESAISNHSERRPHADRLISDYAYKIDGRSTTRVAQLIYSAATEGSGLKTVRHN